METAGDFANRGTPGFWTTAERAQLIRSLLEHIPLPSSDHSLFEGVVGTCEGGNKGQDTWKDDVARATRGHAGDFLFRCLEKLEIVVLAVPLHRQEEATAVFQGTMKGLFSAPVDAIQDYYGSDVCFYFAWMQFFTKALLVPAVAGLAMWFCRPAGVTVDNSPLVPFFSLGMVLWAILFVVYWDRAASGHACRWGTLDLDNKDEVRGGCGRCACVCVYEGGGGAGSADGAGGADRKKSARGGEGGNDLRCWFAAPRLRAATSTLYSGTRAFHYALV